jgi:hypothetical protein
MAWMLNASLTSNAYHPFALSWQYWYYEPASCHTWQDGWRCWLGHALAEHWRHRSRTAGLPGKHCLCQGVACLITDSAANGYAAHHTRQVQGIWAALLVKTSQDTH